MKVTAKRTCMIVRFTKTELVELEALLREAVDAKKRYPITWAMKAHRKREQLLAALTGMIDGARHFGRDPDAAPEDHHGGNPYDDDDRLLSEAYAAAYREARKLGLGSTRR